MPGYHASLYVRDGIPRVLSAYVCDDPLLTLEATIHRMTGLHARVFRLEKRRSLVREGCFADLVLFDPEQIRDYASATDPTAPPSGILASFVAGRRPVLGTGRRLVCAPPERCSMRIAPSYLGSLDAVVEASSTIHSRNRFTFGMSTKIAGKTR